MHRPTAAILSRESVELGATSATRLSTRQGCFPPPARAAQLTESLIDKCSVIGPKPRRQRHDDPIAAWIYLPLPDVPIAKNPTPK